MNSAKPLRIIFAGTPQFAADHLQALLSSEHEVAAVFTQPDRAAGRGKKLQPSPVKQLALTHTIDTYQPDSLKQEDQSRLIESLAADVMVVVAYGLIIPHTILDTPRLGCINVHGSLLPRWRGAAPVQRAIEAGDKESGITIMQMDKGLDTGPMLLKKTCPIDETDTSASLFEKLSELGPIALLEALVQLEQLAPQDQDDSLANYAAKISKEEALIDWRLNAATLQRKIRAYFPAPTAYTHLNGERLKIQTAVISAGSGEPGEILRTTEDGIVVACGEGSLCITQLQLPGKKAAPAGDILRGNGDKFQPGFCFDRAAQP